MNEVYFYSLASAAMFVSASNGKVQAPTLCYLFILWLMYPANVGGLVGATVLYGAACLVATYR